MDKSQIAVLLQELAPLIEQRQAKLGLYLEKPESFNIFEVISDQYKKENLHSAILEFLLKNEPSFLKLFLKHLDNLKCLDGSVGNRLKTYFDTGSNIFVQREAGRREAGRVDILIHNGKQAIIIENKIKDAHDMNTQLCRYYHYAQQRGLEVVAIIYLPLSNHKEPPIELYQCDICKANKTCIGRNRFDFASLRKFTKILNIQSLVEILTQCTPEQEDMNMLVRHYANLLRKIGAKSMTETENIAVIKEIFSKKDSLQAAYALAEIWHDKENYIRHAVNEVLCNSLRKEGYSDADDIFWDKRNKLLVKPLTGNDYFQRIIYKPQWFTLALEPKDSSMKQDADIVLSSLNCRYLTHLTPPEGNAFFSHRNFYFKELNPQDTLEEIVNQCMVCFGKLQKLATTYCKK